MARKSFDPRTIDGRVYGDASGRQCRFNKWIGPPKEDTEGTPSLLLEAILALLRQQLYADEESELYRRFALGLTLEEIAVQDEEHRSSSMRRLDRKCEALRTVIEEFVRNWTDDYGCDGVVAWLLPKPRDSGSATSVGPTQGSTGS